MASKLNKTISIRLDDETFNYYNKLAEKDRRKVAEYIRIVLEDLKTTKDQPPPAHSAAVSVHPVQ